MSHPTSGQSPSATVPPQPPKSEAYSTNANPAASAAAPMHLPNPMTRNLSEFAVGDTPLATASPTANSPGTDYLSCRRNPYNQPSGNPTAGIHGGKPTSARERRATRYEGEGQETLQNENEDAQGKMETYGEGEVADAVERARRGRNTSGGPHGRVRGEVSLWGEEGSLERKKALQEVEREQIRRMRERGEDVDGRGGREERKPGVEI
ncbi:hypothetical protein QBC40DRAFT_230828 [Triangularia verruculosa]|uniref:Uncharacterized protein n=1 Tax=Triangularia verruculosa TaxID=2587418 RepID=A0AAN6XCD2_9PEZI|nr:hypothetical protein QBC40DRAFT_230828 [Triangularia verruculosa]